MIGSSSLEKKLFIVPQRSSLINVTSWLVLIGLGVIWWCLRGDEREPAKLLIPAHGSETNMVPVFWQNPDDQKAPQQDVSAVASLSKKTFKHGEPISVSFTITNRSGGQITIWLSGFWPNHYINVRDQNGIEPPLTAVGQERRKAFQPSGPRRKNIPFVLKPNDVFQNDIRPDLSDLYQLGPGRYTVEITYDDRQSPTPLSVTSAAVAFDVGR
jgi:hypothetical protein